MIMTAKTNFPLLIINYTWCQRYKEIIQIIGGPPLWLHRMPYSKAGRRKFKCSDVTWARSTQSSQRQQLVFFLAFLFRRFRFLRNDLNPLHLVMVLQDQIDMAECQLWCRFSEITTFYSGIILSKHLIICFEMGYTDFRSNWLVQVTSAFRSFRSASSFKMAARIGH